MAGRILGLTGGIGSGKSSVAKMLSRMGIPVYYSDDRTKALYDELAPLRSALVALLGPTVCVGDRIDRREMARIVFADASLLARVEETVYPYLLADFRTWVQAQSAPFVVFESALLLEKPMFRQVCDRVLTVSSPVEVRMERVMQRDGVQPEQVLARMQHQWTDAQREALADEVLVSDNHRAVLPQVVAVYRNMIALNKNV